MSSSSLTAKYRPQRFADVAGQAAVKSILSRAAAEDRIAPAYLFSGTRGVGKTTLARVLAKAVNCEKAPTAEPCNACRNCRQITAGAAVDVVEIDAASNRGIEDARRLKEDIGYAPIECRYKVFIIDEAHMLTREAFNALLKTLEEPPGHASFILATTEPHKFPATIISRCQHYTFKRLTQKELEDHLAGLLEREGIDFDPAAVSLVAKRGAGSVRDSMSLLSQVLALGSERLAAEDVRQVLGLAGKDVFFEIMGGIHGRDCPGLTRILRQVLDQGLDLGFFLRELTAGWRNMFLIRQAGDAAADVLDMPVEELAAWKNWASRFELSHIHACWQLTLEGQRRVLTSLEPALALELLLFNLACLPQILNLESGQAVPPQNAAQAAPSPGNAPGRGAAPGPKAAGPDPSVPAASQTQVSRNPQARPELQAAPQPTPRPETAAVLQTAEIPKAAPTPAAGTAKSPAGSAPVSGPASVARPKPAPTAEPAQQPAPIVPSGPKNWEGFLRYVGTRKEATGKGINGIRLAKGEYDEGELRVLCHSEMHISRIKAGDSFDNLKAYAREYFGGDVVVRLESQHKMSNKSRKEIRDEIMSDALVQGLFEKLNATIIDFR